MRKRYLVTKEEAYKLLDIHPPFSLEDLKRQYRLAAKRYHPDKNKGNDEFFKKANSANELLSLDCVILSEVDKVKIPIDPKFYSPDTTVEGHLLTDLGQGSLGRNCNACVGKGYQTQSSPKIEKCVCNKPGSSIFVQWKCTKGCNGTGFIELGKILRHYFCRNCEGSGKVIIQNTMGGYKP